ncbi:hypothetical protein [Wolbachia endosymbiont of Pentidionis agamae]|uniref:hypothetical protein n=1 Tax=Wolbachia endosymbiont of Pentidionis agamae TaxID=3110435 RepID=UPI002FD3DAB1
MNSSSDDNYNTCIHILNCFRKFVGYPPHPTIKTILFQETKTSTTAVRPQEISSIQYIGRINKYLKWYEFPDLTKCFSDLSQNNSSFISRIEDKDNESKTLDLLIIGRTHNGNIAIIDKPLTNYEPLDIIGRDNPIFDCLNDIINNFHYQDNICEQVRSCLHRLAFLYEEEIRKNLQTTTEPGLFDFEGTKKLEETTNSISNTIKDIKGENFDNGITHQTISSVQYNLKTTPTYPNSAVENMSNIDTTQPTAIESGQNSEITRVSVGVVLG